MELINNAEASESTSNMEVNDINLPNLMSIWQEETSHVKEEFLKLLLRELRLQKEDIETALKSLKENQSDENWIALRNVANLFKGSCTAAQLNKLFEISKQIEELAQMRDVFVFDFRILELMNISFSKVMKALSKELEDIERIID